MTPTSPFQSATRQFQIWEYQVSHAQLLVRSPKAPATRGLPECLTNVDLVCRGVVYLAIPHILNGITLEPPTSAEVSALESLLSKPIEPSRMQMLVSSGRRFPIVALSFDFSENDWDIFESPFEFRSHFRQKLIPK